MPALSAYQETIKRYSTEEIGQMYKDGDITAAQKSSILRDKARLHLDQMLEENGYFGAIIQKTVENIGEGWENLKEAATASPDQGLSKGLMGSAQAMWGQIQILTSVFSAVGEVTGKVAENTALRAGAPPGLAWWIGFSVDVGVGFLPVGGLGGAVIKTAQTTAAKAASKVASESSHDARLLGMLKQALEKDGVANAEGLIQRAVISDEGVVKVVAEAAEAVSTRPTFMQEASKFAGDIGVTEARAELPKLMKKFGISFQDLKKVKDLWQGKKSMTAQDFYGYLKALESQSGELSSLAKKAISATATEADKAAFAKAATQLFTGATNKISYSKEFTDLLIHWDPENVAKGNLVGAVETFAKDMASLTPRQTGQLSWKAQDSTLNMGLPFQHVKEVFMNMLLPFASLPAMVGNTVGSMNMVLERATAGHLDEATIMAKAMMMATGDGLKSVKLAYQTAPGGAIGRWGNLPTTSMVAMDAFYKVIDMRASLTADALRLFKGSPNAAAQIKAYVLNPPAQAIEDAAERALRATYQNDLGRWAAAFRGLAQAGPGTAYFTFVKSPINLVKYGWERTPALQLFSGKLWADVLAGGTRASDAMGRLTLANLQAFYWFELAKQGLVTGSGPVDPELKRAWRATNEPYSFKTPVGHIPISAYQPASSPIMLIADLASIADQLDEESFGQAAMAAIYAFMNTMANQTSWRTLSNLVDVVQQAQHGEDFTKKSVTDIMSPASALLTPPIVARTKQVLDPVQRDAVTYIDSLKARTPGFSEKAPAMRDAYGDPIIPPQSVGPSWFGYFYPIVPKIKPLETDPVKIEGARLGVRAPYFPDFIGERPSEDSSTDITQKLPGLKKPGVSLTAKERDRWQQLYSNALRHKDEGLKALIDSPEYQEAPEALKRAWFSSQLGLYKEQAKQNLLAEDAGLGKRYYTSTMNAQLPTVDPAERAGVADTYNDFITNYESYTADQLEELSKWGMMEPDQPKTQAPVTIGGVEVVGEKKYTPSQFEQLAPASQKELLGKGALPIPGLPASESKTDVDIRIGR